MEIRKIHIDQITPASYNPRRNLRETDPAYNALKKSIEEFGIVEPLIWNEATGNLVGGHQRLAILKASGITEVTVSVVNLDEPKEKALNIALNKIEGEWDDAALTLLIEDIGAEMAELTGFDTQEIDDMLTKLEINVSQAEIESLMVKPVERPAPTKERVSITLRGSPEVITQEEIKELRAKWSPKGVEVNVST